MNSRQKGKKGELELAKVLRGYGYPARRGQQYSGANGDADVVGLPHVHIECKRVEALNIDKYGLDEIDNKILLTIIDKFKGGPVGINTIATAIGEDGGTIEEVYEPFLIKEGFIKRTPRGREVTELAYSHLGRTMGNRYGNPLQGDLFE